MSDTPSDHDVLAACSSEPGAFVTIFSRHFAEIHRYMARRVGTEQADDLAAEVFTRALQSCHRYEARHDDARPWLYGIAANSLFKHRRSEGRQLRVLARAGSHGSYHDPLPASVDRLDAAALAPRLAAALRRLEPRDREVLLLFAWAELSYAEIATALSIPIGTVRSRLSRARERIAGALDAPGADDVVPGIKDISEGAAHA
jgi:RNA polymerase sigma-70 factor (ECF subfamily)